MEVGYELEINISRKELRLLLLHEFRLNHKATVCQEQTNRRIGKMINEAE